MSNTERENSSLLDEFSLENFYFRWYIFFVKEYIAILDSKPEDIDLTAFVFDNQKKNILPYFHATMPKETGFEILRSRMRSLFYPYKYKVFISLDSSEAVTIYDRVAIDRGDSTTPVFQTDLDNFISKAMWQVFEKGRVKALERLKIGEIDLLLRDVGIYNVYIDGKQWDSEEATKGRKAEVCIFLTFVTRPLEMRMKAILPKRASASFVSEAGSATAHLLSRFNSKPIILASIFDDHCDLFFAEHGGKSFFHDSFNWGVGHISRSLAQAYGLSRGAAEGILEKLDSQDTSSYVGEKLLKLTRKELRTFIRGIMHAKMALKARIVYLDSFRLFNMGKFSKIVRCLSGSEVLKEFDILIEGREIKKKTALSLFAPKPKNFDISIFSAAAFIEERFLPRDNILNRFARRRMRWLLGGQ